MLGGIEAGGTKFRCIVGDDPTSIADEIRIETAGPEETLTEVVRFFRDQSTKHTLDAVGIELARVLRLRCRHHDENEGEQ